MVLLCRSLFLLLLAGILAACGSAAESAPRVEISDSAGVRIVMNRSARWAEGEAWRVPGEPELVIGTLAGPPEEQFVEIAAAARQSDGDIVLADRGAAAVRLYNREGLFLRTLGGQGSGPGEYRDPASVLVTVGDSITVWDDQLYRSTRYDPSGNRVAIHTLDRATLAKAVEPPLYPGPGMPLPNGDVLVRLVEKAKDQLSGVFRASSGLLRAEKALRHVDTVVFFGDVEQVGLEAPFGSFPVRAPLARKTSIAHGGDSLRICVGTQRQPQVQCFGPGGSSMLVRWSGEPGPVREEDMTRWREETLEALGDKLAEDQVRPLLRKVPRPTQRPPYSDIHLDEPGNLWVRLGPTRKGPPSWIDHGVFDSQGALLGTVLLPPIRVLEIGRDYVLGVHNDELEVEYLHLYPLVKPEEGEEQAEASARNGTTTEEQLPSVVF